MTASFQEFLSNFPNTVVQFAINFDGPLDVKRSQLIVLQNGKEVFCCSSNISYASFVSTCLLEFNVIKAAKTCSTCSVKNLDMIHCWSCQKPVCLDCYSRRTTLTCMVCSFKPSVNPGQSILASHVREMQNKYWENRNSILCS
jgi:hypothetical protein